MSDDLRTRVAKRMRVDEMAFAGVKEKTLTPFEDLDAPIRASWFRYADSALAEILDLPDGTDT